MKTSLRNLPRINWLSYVIKRMNVLQTVDNIPAEDNRAVNGCYAAWSSLYFNHKTGCVTEELNYIFACNI